MLSQVANLNQQFFSTALSISAFRVYALLAVIVIIVSWLAKLIFFLNKVEPEKSVQVQPRPGLFDGVPRLSPWFSWYWNRLFWLFQIGGGLVFIASLVRLFVTKPQVISPELPLFESMMVTDKQPLVVEFDRPVSKRLTGKIIPHVPGEWVYSSNIYGPFFSDQFKFIPYRSLISDTEYIVEIKDILPIGWLDLSAAKDFMFVFKTPPLASVENIKPENNSDKVKIDFPIEVTFSPKETDLVEWSFEIDPSIETTKIFDRNTVRLVPKTRLKQGTKYLVKVFRTPVIFDYQKQRVVQKLTKELIHKSSFTTVESPTIAGIKPNGNAVLPQEPLVINFKQPMNRKSVEEAFTINPSIYGDKLWSNDQQLIFKPSPSWSLDTTYTITFDTKTKTKYGGVMEQSYVHRFSTLGEIRLVSTTPADKAEDVKTETPISMTFDQSVEHQTAEKNFFIEPKINGIFSWDNNTLIFTPQKPLSYGHQYKVKLAPKVKSIYGNDSQKAFEWTFTTAKNMFSLDIPLYKQHHMFTCFSVASQMVLAYRGIKDIDELDFMDEIGYDNTPRNFLTNTWGDPNKGVVGTYDGKDPGGYGAHWDPVAKALSKYRSVEVKRNWNLTDLLYTVEQDNPVMVWWVNGVWPAKEGSWNLPSGEKVYTVNGMHVEVVKGWVGDKSKPDFILTNDPWRGSRQYTPEQFNNLWKWFENTAVIVY